jgi:O-antigen ligase
MHSPARGARPLNVIVDPRHLLWPAGACIAVAVPSLLAYNLPPSATFFNQALALFGWGSWLVLLVPALPTHAVRWPSGLVALLGALGLLLLAALAAPAWTGQPWSLSLSAGGLIAAAAVTCVVAALLQQHGLGTQAFRAFCIGLLVAGVLGSLIGGVQVYAPQWADGNWIARSAEHGRAVGNLRQPNHLCSLLVWGLIATAWLAEARVLRRAVAAGTALLLVFALVLSASRSGVIGVAVLALWGLLDRQLSGRTRLALLLAPVVYALMWAGASAWAHHSQQVFLAESRFSGAGDISSSRFGIWANTLSLIGADPWWGVGFGEFNFAWTLTPFPRRPVAFFDHAHNLPLHLAAELGLPLATLVLGLLGWALWCAWRAAGAAVGSTSVPASQPANHLHAALVMVLMILVHSLLEYPLWYAYFLLPAAFALGMGLGAPAGAAAPARSAPSRLLMAGAVLMMLGALVAVRDYLRVVIIFVPPANAAPLEQRIDDGQRSWFFSHHGDYAAVTTALNPEQAMSGLRGAPHYLLDARLMIAWATLLHEAGDEQRARHVAQRLKEFRNEQAKEFFAPCAPAASAALPAGTAPPFQCLAPDAPLGYRDFRSTSGAAPKASGP